ncbi:MAG: endospore germination permease [Bacillota bacterium]
MFTEKIVSRQLFYLLFIMRVTIVISVLPVLTAGEALQDAWIAGAVSFIPSAAIVTLIGALTIAFPGKSLVQYSQELLGSIAGKFISLIYLGIFLFMAGTDLRIYAEVLKTGFLPETPISVIMALVVFVAVLVIFGGLEVLGRTADIIFPIFLLMILGSLFFPLIHADFQNIQPVIARGWSPLFLAIVAPTSVTAQYANLTMLAPSLDEQHKTLKVALWSLLAATFVLVCFAVVVVLVLGPDVGSRAAFPVFKMIRATRISEFLERVEIITIFAWGLGLFIALSVNLYSGSKGLSQVFGLQDNRPLILPMAVIWVVFGIQGYRDFFEVAQVFDPAFFDPIFITALLFPMLVLWTAYLYKRPWKKQPRGTTQNKG